MNSRRSRANPAQESRKNWQSEEHFANLKETKQKRMKAAELTTPAPVVS
jgi:hypothetical protein